MDIHTLTARELLAHLDRGELSSAEVVEALFDHSAQVDSRLRGFVHRFHEQALADAQRADDARARGESLGPLHGLPISVKESVDTIGVPSTMGMRARLGTTASSDAVCVKLARAAGAIVLGKTNVPQTLLSPMETTNFIWGTTRNPWSAEHAPGGSSGGEGAVIASGQSPLGIGTDIGGSIRCPAAFCGVAGLKPTFPRWSNVGSNTAVPGQELVRAQIGPLGRTTADLTLFLRALDSPTHTPHDPTVPPVPIGDPNAVDASRLRIGWYDDDGFFRPAASVRRAVREAVATLEECGAQVVEFRPPNAADLIYVMLAALSSDGGESVKQALKGEEFIQPLQLLNASTKVPGAARKALARTAGALGEPRVARMLKSFGRKGVRDFWQLAARRTQYEREETAAWRRADIHALVCPVHPTPAVPHGMSRDFTLAFCYAARYNALNLPAGVVPVTRVRADEIHRERLEDRLDRRAASIESRSAGLPLGVQVVGPRWREDIVLAVMQIIEDRARQSDGFPWTPVVPDGSADRPPEGSRAATRPAI